LDFSQVSAQLAQQDLLEWAGLITGILYVILASYERSSCWVFGIISSACIAWKSFTDYFLVADGILQIFYILIGVLGLINWINGRKAGHEKPVITSPLVKHLLAIVICLLISWPVSWVLITYADARYGYPDTVLTFLSVWATLLLVWKDLHNWVYWIMIDIAYVGLYWQSEGYLFAILFLIYALISVWGWKRWKASLRIQQKVL
jgi:nicotinamide mononucleotide transporter